MKNFTICFTGMSGSGKSTLAIELEKKLKEREQKVQLIDGDILRAQLGNLFGYTREERMKNSRVVRVLAKYLNENDIHTIVAIVAPYEQMRSELREFIGKQYVEIYTKCSYEVCLQRDVKGYYQKQLLGKMNHINGADDIFEEPFNSDIVIDTSKETIEDSVKIIMNYLEENFYVV